MTFCRFCDLLSNLHVWGPWGSWGPWRRLSLVEVILSNPTYEHFVNYGFIGIQNFFVCLFSATLTAQPVLLWADLWTDWMARAMVDLIGGRPQDSQSGFISTRAVITAACLPALCCALLPAHSHSLGCELCHPGQQKQAKPGCWWCWWWCFCWSPPPLQQGVRRGRRRDSSWWGPVKRQAQHKGIAT